MSVEFTVVVCQASFCGGHSFTDRDDLAFRTDGAGLIGEWTNEVDLEFQRSVAHANGKSGVNGAAHTGIEQGSGVSAVYGP